MPVAVSQLLADPVGSLAANPEWTRYAFMFPVGIVVATCAQTAGIGGAAIMGPFFLLGFPLLGPAYPLHSVASSVATAILSEAFGFSSGDFLLFLFKFLGPYCFCTPSMRSSLENTKHSSNDLRLHLPRVLGPTYD